MTIWLRFLEALRSYVGFAVLGAILLIGLALLPPQPAYGPYTRLDLISLTDYRTTPVAGIVGNELELMRMIHQVGLSETLDVLSHDGAYQKEVECHVAAHAVGRAAFDLLGAGAFAQCSTACFSGCIHGAFEQMAARTGGEDELLNSIRSLCSKRGTEFEEDQCFHGAGHGLMIYAHYDIPSALSACRKLGDGPEPNWCYGGVFMENTQNGPLASVLVGTEKPKDAYYPCDALGADTLAVRWCYHYQPDIFLSVNGGDFAKASAACLTAPEAARSDCFKRLGQLSGIDAPDASAATEQFCNTVPKSFFTECIQGGLREVIYYNGLSALDKPILFCTGLKSGDAKSACYAEYAERMKNLYNDKARRLSLCAEFESPYDESCRAVQDAPASFSDDLRT